MHCWTVNGDLRPYDGRDVSSLSTLTNTTTRNEQTDQWSGTIQTDKIPFNTVVYTRA